MFIVVAVDECVLYGGALHLVIFELLGKSDGPSRVALEDPLRKLVLRAEGLWRRPKVSKVVELATLLVWKEWKREVAGRWCPSLRRAYR